MYDTHTIILIGRRCMYYNSVYVCTHILYSVYKDVDVSQVVNQACDLKLKLPA